MNILIGLAQTFLALVVAGLAVALVVTPIYDHFSDDPAKKIAEFADGLLKLILIAVGVPAAAITLLICIVWPPILVVIIIGIFLTIGWKLRHVPMPAGAANSDFVTPLLIGVVIGSSIHHDR